MDYIFKKRKPKVYICPKNYLSEIDQQCERCNQKIQYSKCISICQCYLFTHTQCFLQKIKPIISSNTQYICTRCSYKLNFKIQVQYNFQFDKKTLFTFMLGIFLVILLGILVNLGFYNQIASDKYMYIILALFTLLLFVSLLYASRQPKIVQMKIIQTNLVQKDRIVDIDFDDQTKSDRVLQKQSITI